jgi:hypothetical protein
LAVHSLTVPPSQFTVLQPWISFLPGNAEVRISMQIAPPGHPPFEPEGAPPISVQVPELIGPGTLETQFGFPRPFTLGRPDEPDMEAVLETRRRMLERAESLPQRRSFGERLRTFWRPQWSRPPEGESVPAESAFPGREEGGDSVESQPSGEEPPPRRSHRRRGEGGRN